MSDSVKLNIGAGDTVIEGFTPIDRKLGSEAYPLDYPDNSVNEIRASHVLEHFTFAEAQNALTDWVRVLKPGARLRIAVPDMDKVISARVSGDNKWPFYLMGGQTDTDNIHRSVFDVDLLTTFMRSSGLTDILHWSSHNTDTASHPVSLNLQGIKPLTNTAASSVDVKIKAVMSVPRYGSTASRGVIEAALKPFGLGLETSGGVFWGQRMQAMFNTCLEQGVDWILTIDYDSLFTAKHLDALMGALGNNPHIDAIAALQSRRCGDRPLMTVGGAQSVETDGTPIKVTTAHFGLTLIRVDTLKDVAKPWFFGQPHNGEWDDERLDPDIWFWHQWRLAGKNIYVHPNVSIGHLQEMVSDFDESLNPRVSTVEQWKERNKPHD